MHHITYGSIDAITTNYKEGNVYAEISRVVSATKNEHGDVASTALEHIQLVFFLCGI